VTIAFTVIGTPAPKGSSRAVMRGKRAILIPSDTDAGKERQRSWSSAVMHAAHEACGDIARPLFRASPLRIELVFVFARPSGHYTKSGMLKRSAPLAPAVKPDIDKVVRCTLDALTGVVFDDDSRVVRLIASKAYAHPNEAPGAMVEVSLYK
jgi:Holliday junction resolvase RusA-like endonuclease